jgi:hypothetical protein
MYQQLPNAIVTPTTLVNENKNKFEVMPGTIFSDDHLVGNPPSYNILGSAPPSVSNLVTAPDSNTTSIDQQSTFSNFHDLTNFEIVVLVMILILFGCIFHLLHCTKKQKKYLKDLIREIRSSKSQLSE